MKLRFALDMAAIWPNMPALSMEGAVQSVAQELRSGEPSIKLSRFTAGRIVNIECDGSLLQGEIEWDDSRIKVWELISA